MKMFLVEPDTGPLAKFWVHAASVAEAAKLAAHRLGLACTMTVTGPDGICCRFQTAAVWYAQELP